MSSLSSPRTFTRPVHALRGTPLRPTPARPLRIPSRRAAVVPSAASRIGDIAKYISEAAARIFTPQDEGTDVPWERTAGAEFTGKIAHHEDVARLRELRELVSKARTQLEGCMDPKADNFDPSATKDDGSCVYAFGDEGDLVTAPGGASSADYVTSSIARIFGHQFKGDESEPQRYYSRGYKARARTQRDLRREVDRLVRFERVVEKTISKAEEKSGSK